MIIFDRKVHILGNGGPLVLLGIFAGEEAMAKEIFELAEELSGGKAFTLAAFETDCWDRDFSPWKANGTSDGETFPGGGHDTLAWLEKALPILKAEDDRRSFICGYSLAGLFALWSVYESSLFDGCACCSGSLWFEGWTEYASGRSAARPSAVYLSLGGKEEKTSNPVMAGIGNATRLQDKLLEKDSNVAKHKLEMNPGGHFANPSKRLAKGIAWLLNETK